MKNGTDFTRVLEFNSKVDDFWSLRMGKLRYPKVVVEGLRLSTKGSSNFKNLSE